MATTRRYLQSTKNLDAVIARVLRLPTEHHVHLRSTDPDESTFATVCLRQRVLPGAGSREAGLAMAMAFKLIEAAQQRWR